MFLRHEPCPKCRENGRDRHGDNLGVFSDGVHCFSCGYSTFVNINGNAIYKPKDERKDKKVGLPMDSTFNLPVEALDWLNQYGITMEEINENKLMWSDYFSRLIFPYFGEGEDLLAWQGRYIPRGTNEVKPKWFSQGNLHTVLVVKGSGDPLVVVEDIVSAIKVGRVTRAMPIFGSKVHRNLISLVDTKTVMIWLDYDKYLQATKESESLRKLGYVSYTVASRHDPKCYTEEEIRNFLRR